jgi:cyanate permease
MTIQPPPVESDLRTLAIAQLRKKRDLQAHALAYVVVNLFLVGIWFFATPHVFFWPMFPLFGWGIGLAFNTWDVYSPERASEERIEREMQRLARR